MKPLIVVALFSCGLPVLAMNAPGPVAKEKPASVPQNSDQSASKKLEKTVSTGRLASHIAGSKKVEEASQNSIEKFLDKQYILPPEDQPHVLMESKVGKVAFAYTNAENQRVVRVGKDNVLFNPNAVKLVNIVEDPIISKITYKDNKQGNLSVLGVLSLDGQNKNTIHLKLKKKQRYCISDLNEVNWSRFSREVFFYKKYASFLPPDLDIFVVMGVDLLKLEAEKEEYTQAKVSALTSLPAAQYDMLIGAKYARLLTQANTNCLVTAIPLRENPISDIRDSKFQTPTVEDASEAVPTPEASPQLPLGLRAKIKRKLMSVFDKPYTMASAEDFEEASTASLDCSGEDFDPTAEESIPLEKQEAFLKEILGDDTIQTFFTQEF